MARKHVRRLPKNSKRIDLNTLPTFSWAVCSDPDKGFGKVSIGDETFWIRDIQRAGKRFTGIIDNHLICTDVHGLKYNDLVIFNETH